MIIKISNKVLTLVLACVSAMNAEAEPIEFCKEMTLYVHPVDYPMAGRLASLMQLPLPQIQTKPIITRCSVFLWGLIMSKMLFGARIDHEDIMVELCKAEKEASQVVSAGEISVTEQEVEETFQKHFRRVPDDKGHGHTGSFIVFHSFN
ncbi:hypothetical protein FACS189472_01800 [Alphaproteobacteria bacterium]|nr:hypothetical protein FACS189472_01800 [Alphaproteobacteria bacterium]